MLQNILKLEMTFLFYFIPTHLADMVLREKRMFQ